MKLTPAQQKVVNKFLEMELIHGKGNVFLRYVNDYWKTMFVTHKKGSKKIDVIFNEEYKVNGRIINSMDSKGLFVCYNSDHDIIENPNKAYHDGASLIGSRIKVA